MVVIKTDSEAVQLLKSNGVSPTSQRVQIARYLFAKSQHLNADQLQALVNQGGTKVSRATIYNTLALFVKKGLVREIIADPNRVFYDSNVSQHHHMFNIDTGELTDIDLDQLEITSVAQLPEDVTLERLDVVLQVRNRSDKPDPLH